MEETTKKLKKSLRVKAHKEAQKAQVGGPSTASLRNFRGSASKTRLVADLVRGKKVDEALFILRYSNKRVSSDLEKLLLSAINNWEANNEGASVEDSALYVKRISVDDGRILRRMRSAARGRGHIIRKRTNHVTVIIDSLKNGIN